MDRKHWIEFVEYLIVVAAATGMANSPRGQLQHPDLGRPDERAATLNSSTSPPVTLDKTSIQPVFPEPDPAAQYREAPPGRNRAPVTEIEYRQRAVGTGEIA